MGWPALHERSRAGEGRRAILKRPLKSSGWWLVLWSAIAVAAVVAIVFAVHGTGEAGLRVALRATARTSLVLFLLAFVASSLRLVAPGAVGRWLVTNRRYLGVSFAASHVIHLLLIIRFLPMSREPVDLVALILGGLGYVFIAAMVATSFDATADWLGPKLWRRLHKTGIYYLWTIFFLTYLGNAGRDRLALGSVLLLLAALAFRAFAGRLAERRALVAAT